MKTTTTQRDLEEMVETLRKEKIRNNKKKQQNKRKQASLSSSSSYAPEKKPPTMATLDDLFRLGGNNLHQTSRAKSRHSHMQFTTSMHNLSKESFRKRIFEYYIERKRSDKPISMHYIRNVISTINSHYNMVLFSKYELSKFLKILNKIYNSENRDKTYFTSDDKEHLNFEQIVQASLNMKRETKLKREFEEMIMPAEDKTSAEKKQFYTSENLDQIKSYYQTQLDVFLASSRKNLPTAHNELALLIVFLNYTPKRVNEILNLTYEKTLDLILKQQVQIKSKQGGGTSDIIVPQNLSYILSSYLTHKPPDAPTLFTSNYIQMYRLYKQQLKTVFNLNISKLFHGYRHVFSYENIGKNAAAVKDTLGHTNFKTTHMYAQNYRRWLGSENPTHVKKLLNDRAEANETKPKPEPKPEPPFNENTSCKDKKRNVKKESHA